MILPLTFALISSFFRTFLFFIFNCKTLTNYKEHSHINKDFKTKNVRRQVAKNFLCRANNCSKLASRAAQALHKSCHPEQPRKYSQILFIVKSTF